MYEECSRCYIKNLNEDCIKHWGHGFFFCLCVFVCVEFYEEQMDPCLHSRKGLMSLSP